MRVQVLDSLNQHTLGEEQLHLLQKTAGMSSKTTTKQLYVCASPRITIFIMNRPG
jgi:hypothetical protein